MGNTIKENNCGCFTGIIKIDKHYEHKRDIKSAIKIFSIEYAMKIFYSFIQEDKS